MDEGEIVELFSSKDGAAAVGGVEFEGEVDPWDLAELAGTAPEADLGPLSAAEYEIFLQGGDPQRSRDKAQSSGVYAELHRTMDHFNEIKERREQLAKVFVSWSSLGGNNEWRKLVSRLKSVIERNKTSKPEKDAVQIYSQVIEMYILCEAMGDHLKVLRSRIGQHDSELADEIGRIALAHYSFARSELDRATVEIGHVLEERGVKAHI